MFPQEKNGESSNHQPQPTTAQLQEMGLGLGLGLTDTFARASFVEEEEEEGDEGNWDETEEEVIEEENGKEKDKEKGKGKQAEQKQKEVKDTRTDGERAEAEQRLATAEQARATISDAALAAKGIEWDEDWFFSDEREFLPVRNSVFNPQKGSLKTLRKRHNFFADMANMPELFMELAKHLRIKDLLSLYAISIDFHETINGHLSHCMKLCADYMAPESAKLYPFKFYGWLCVKDPAGRPHSENEEEVKRVPSLKWLQMVVHREKMVRDILACMARQGHRMPEGMALSLKKMWLLMDISTTKSRIHMIHNIKLFTDMDLYNIQFFIVKLDMRFNDPVDGPGDDGMRKLFLGQRGLTPLCNLLKRKAYLEIMDIVRLGIRYSYRVRPEHRGMELFGVPAEEIGVGHTEGWGAGRVHLMRPDELMMRESVRRQMGLKNYIMNMMIWGYVNPITGKDIQVSEEEMYMSDDEEEPRNPHFSNYYAFKKGDGDPEEDFDLEDEGEEDDDDQDDEEDDDDDDDDGNYFFGTGAT